MNFNKENKLPVLFIENFFLFPDCENFIFLNSLENEKLKNYIKQIFKNLWEEKNEEFNHVLIVPKNEENKEENFSLGILAKIFFKENKEENFLKINKINFKGLKRVKIFDLIKNKNNILEGKFEELNEKELNELNEKLFHYFPEIVKKSNLKYLEKISQINITMMKGNITNIIDFITQNGKDIDSLSKLKILNSSNVSERLDILINLPDYHKLEKEIDDKTRENIKEQQKNYFLAEKIKILEKKLRSRNGGISHKMEEYLKKIEKDPYPNYVKKAIREEIERYNLMSSGNTGEANIIEQHISWIVNLPWWQIKEEKINNLKKIREKLNKSHYGLEEIKEKIVENFALYFWKDKQKKKELKKQKNKKSSSVICFVGPSGTGKTSLASSIAESQGREFAIISLGGINDVAEIQGHRQTYMMAMPGRIIQAMKKVGCINPVILIDEIDKIGRDGYRGDPSYALLNILDSSQNDKFVDNYLGQEFPYDLSKVLFICTANDLYSIPNPLLDRLDIINTSSYTQNEKIKIAEEHIIPNFLNEFFLNEKKFKIEKEAIKDIIRYYTRESGVRELSRKIKKIISKFIVELIENNKKELILSSKEIENYLKKRRYDFTHKQKTSEAGVATGLAYTESGGDILMIETVHYPKKEGELNLTGNLGDIMKESALAALNYIKFKSNYFGIKTELFKNGIHIHVPEGATPKEGPSAGIALTSSIISSLTGQIISSDIGMTGEITILGNVKAIGGLKEKTIAAHRSGLKTIIIPKSNEKDIKDIPLEIRKEIEILFVEKYEEVWEIILKKTNEN